MVAIAIAAGRRNRGHVSRECMRELAARHGLDADALIEAWVERAALREHLAQFDQRAAEVFAIGDVERMYRQR